MKGEGKNQIRKKLYAKLIDTLRLIREDLLEGESDVAFLGREGRKSTRPPIRTMEDFPRQPCFSKTAMPVFPTSTPLMVGKRERRNSGIVSGTGHECRH